MVQNNKGLTLIELLASLTLSSIILLIVYSVFFQGTEFSQVVNNRTSLQQEANNIIRSLTTVHQITPANGNYVFQFFDVNGTALLTSNNDTRSFSVTINNATNNIIRVLNFNKENVIYELNVLNANNNWIDMQNNNLINPRTTNLTLQITLTDVTRPTITYTTETIFSRLNN